MSLFTRLRGVFYGHWIVGFMFLCLTISMGCGSFAYSLFVKPLNDALGWSRGEVMGGYTVFFVTMGLVSPLVGRLVDVRGARQVIPAGALVMGLGFVLLSTMSSLLLLYLGYALVGVGAAGFGSTPSSAVVSNWFKKRRGTAIGLSSAGIGAGGVVMPLVVGYLLEAVGWRSTYLALAAIVWVTIIPLAFLVVRTRPSELGLHPDGATEPPVEVAGAYGNPRRGVSFKAAYGSLAFWLIAMSFLLSNFGRMGGIQSQGPNLMDLGFSTAIAAAALSIIGFGSGVGKFLFGWMCDRMSAKVAAAIGMALQCSAIVVMLMVTPDSSTLVIWTYSLLLGFGAGAWLPTASILTSGTFGLAHYGSIFGAINLLLNLGTATGPLVAGLMFDAMGTYQAAFTVGAIFCGIAVPMVLLVKARS